MHLSAVTASRDNNFNLLRLVAAAVVIFHHSHNLLLGEDDVLWNDHIGSTPGGLAVDVFFVVSGFLVTRSLALRQDGTACIVARALRIFPALLVNLVVVAVLVGPAFTALSFGDYFRDPGVLRYGVVNAQMLFMPYPDNELPGVHVPNGSLWTLPVETCCYVLLLSGWALFLRRTDGRASRGFVATLALLAGGIALYRYSLTAGPHLAWMFGSGAAYDVLRRRIRLSKRAGLSLFGVLLLAGWSGRWFEAVLLLVGRSPGFRKACGRWAGGAWRLDKPGATTTPLLNSSGSGGVAQLGERRVRNAKVGSSILLLSTRSLSR